MVYYGKDWISPSTRVMFTLDYAGLGARSALLDGGMQRWKREGHPVTADVPAPQRGDLSMLHTRSLVVDADWVLAHSGKPHVAIVDARDIAAAIEKRQQARIENCHVLDHCSESPVEEGQLHTKGIN